MCKLGDGTLGGLVLTLITRMMIMINDDNGQPK